MQMNVRETSLKMKLGRVYDRLYDGNCRIEIKVPEKTQALISSI